MSLLPKKEVDNSKITKIRLTVTTTSIPNYTCASHASAHGENVATKLIKVRSANPAFTFLSFQISFEKRQWVDINLKQCYREEKVLSEVTAKKILISHWEVWLGVEVRDFPGDSQLRIWLPIQ